MQNLLQTDESERLPSSYTGETSTMDNPWTKDWRKDLRKIKPLMCSLQKLEKISCPGFGQDRVNFHQNPGRGTAGWAGPTPTWPDRAGYSIAWASRCVPVGGAARRGLIRGSGACGAGPVRERGSVVRSVLSCFLLICIIVVPVPSVCCFC